MTSPEVLIVGAGISGVAAAVALAHRGVTARVAERGRVPGGRMATRRWEGRPVDLGAAYFTVEPGSEFAAVVGDWIERGLAREWTDRFSVAGPDGIGEIKVGPTRYAAPAGLRSLVTDLSTGLDIRLETAVTSVDASADVTILAMPDPQARRLLAVGSPVFEALSGLSQPTIAVALRWEERQWPSQMHGVFVNDSDAIGFIADDGDRRGDGAPVLVVHSTADLARRHLDDPGAALPAMIAATLTTLGTTIAPAATYVHRWTFARPSAPHEERYLFDAESRIGVCGDGWGGRSSVGAAWESGRALGERVAQALA